MQPTSVFLPGKFHGQRSLAGCSPRVHKRVGHYGAPRKEGREIRDEVKVIKEGIDHGEHCKNCKDFGFESR